jgi:hypothetical protein
MNKRYFRIDFNGYGGEVVVGSVTPEFCNYWQDRQQDDLVSHLHSLDFDEGDADSPEICEHGNPSIHDLDDLVHVSGAYSDNGFWVTEVKPNQPEKFHSDRGLSLDEFEDVGNSVHYDFNLHVYGRETYNTFDAADSHVQDAPMSLQPAIAWHSAEKGNFGTAFVETDGEFDPEQIAIGVVETSVASIVEAVWYNRKQLTINFDYADTWCKGTYAQIGCIYKPWFQSNLSEQEIEELLDEIY